MSVLPQLQVLFTVSLILMVPLCCYWERFALYLPPEVSTMKTNVCLASPPWERGEDARAYGECEQAAGMNVIFLYRVGQKNKRRQVYSALLAF